MIICFTWGKKWKPYETTIFLQFEAWSHFIISSLKPLRLCMLLQKRSGSFLLIRSIYFLVIDLFVCFNLLQNLYLHLLCIKKSRYIHNEDESCNGLLLHICSLECLLQVAILDVVLGFYRICMLYYILVENFFGC